MLENIKRGTFIVEYVGEVITNEEAERRGKVYDSVGMTYLFDLDFNLGDDHLVRKIRTLSIVRRPGSVTGPLSIRVLIGPDLICAKDQK